MKTHPAQSAYKKQFSSALEKTLEPKELILSLAKIYQNVNDSLPLSIPVSMNLIETESLRYSMFYQTGRLSKSAIHINQLNDHKYLWTDEGEWSLDDDWFEVASIAQELADIPAMTSIPENVKDLYALIQTGLWTWVPDRFPKFSNHPPNDAEEVLSWDNEFLLVGKTKENTEVVTRAYWEGLCHRENNWFNL